MTKNWLFAKTRSSIVSVPAEEVNAYTAQHRDASGFVLARISPSVVEFLILKQRGCTHHQCDQIWQFFCTLGNHSKLVATIILSKSPTLLGNFCKGLVKFLVNSYLGNFYRHWAIFIWSHCLVASLALGHRKPKWDFETFLHHGLAKTPIPLKLILSFVSFVKHFRLLRHFKHFWNVDQKCVKWRSKIIHSKALLRHCSRGASWL